MGSRDEITRPELVIHLMGFALNLSAAILAFIAFVEMMAYLGGWRALPSEAEQALRVHG